jgi:LemA protein
MKNLIIVAVVAVVAALWLVSVRNGLIRLDETVKEQWSQIDTQLLRRADLVPNLVETVKGYATHEKDIFIQVAEARSRLLSAKGPAAKAEANASMNDWLGRVLALAENYPALRASETFTRLQDELAGTENRIAVARTRYNESVKNLNASIRGIPGCYFAPGLDLKKAEYFQPPQGQNLVQPPQVKF